MIQFVKVDLRARRAYTYAWTGPDPLERGDVVTVPGNAVNDAPTEGRVLRVVNEGDIGWNGRTLADLHTAGEVREILSVQGGELL